MSKIIRAKTALHLKLVADRNSGKVDIGGRSINYLIAEVDVGISSYERMLIYFKNEIAAEVMASSTEDDQQS